MMSKLLALCLFTLLICVPIVDTPRIRHYKWEVKYEYKSPDCYKKLVITINGKSPGPTTLTQQGDTITVEVTNKLLLENLAIHWHGIRQIGTPWSDGIEGVTQCPVVSGDTFKYEFKVDRIGTPWSDGAEGVTQCPVVPGDTFKYEFKVDRSLLIQGKGKFSCSSESLTVDICNTSNPECSPHAITVILGKTYRLRVASLAALSAISFQIEGHNMTMVEADGHCVEPFVVKNLFIYSGETYSVLIKADQDLSRNYMTTNVVGQTTVNTSKGLGCKIHCI